MRNTHRHDIRRRGHDAQLYLLRFILLSSALFFGLINLCHELCRIAG